MGLLTPYYRIVEYLSDGIAVWSQVERYEDSGWAAAGSGVGPYEHWVSQGGLVPATKHRRIHQQAVIRPPFAWSDRFPGCRLDDNGFPLGSVMGAHEEFCDEAGNWTVYS